MSLGRRLRVLKVLQGRLGLRLTEATIAEHAALPLVAVELRSLETDGWVKSDHVDGSPRVWWVEP